MINESDDELDRQYNYISEPSSPRQKEMLLNPYFNKRMKDLSHAYCMRDQYDNCYMDSRPPQPIDPTKKMVSRIV